MERKHLCPQCQALLAIEKHGKLFIRRKELQFVVTGGSVLTTCRRCSTMHEMVIDRDDHGRKCTRPSA